MEENVSPARAALSAMPDSARTSAIAWLLGVALSFREMMFGPWRGEPRPDT